MRTTPIPKLAWKILLALGILVGVVLLLVGEESYHPSVADPGRAQLGSLEYWLGGGLQAGIIGAGLFALVAPRVARWWFLVLAPTIVCFEWGTPAGFWFLGLWLLVAALAVGDLLARRAASRADKARDRTADPVAPEAADEALDGDGIAFHGGPGIVVPLAIGAVLTTAVLLWHAHEVAEVRAYEATAHRARATVVRSDIDEGVTVRFDGREHTISSADGAYPTGEQVEVLVDPRDGNHIDLALEPVDPSWILGWAQVPAALGIAVALAGATIPRRRRVLTSGVTGLDCDWARIGDDPVLVVDGEIVALFRNLEPASPWPAGEDDLDEDVEDPFGDDDDLDDDEAAAVGDEILAYQSLDAEAFGPDLPMGESIEPIALYGRGVVGSSVVVRDAHGALHAAELDDPWPWRRVKATVRGDSWQVPRIVLPANGRTTPVHTPERGTAPDEKFPAPAPLSAFDRWRRAHGGTTAWLLVVPVAVGVALVVRWIVADPADPPGWWRLLLGVLFGAMWVISIGVLVVDLVTPADPGVRVRGRLLDEVFTRAEVARVLAGQQAVTLRLKRHGGLRHDRPALGARSLLGREGRAGPHPGPRAGAGLGGGHPGGRARQAHGGAGPGRAAAPLRGHLMVGGASPPAAAQGLRTRPRLRKTVSPLASSTPSLSVTT